MSVTTDDQHELGEEMSPERRADLLDAEQISAELGVNVKTIWRWMNEGKLRHSKLGQRRVVRRAWLEQFIDDRAE